MILAIDQFSSARDLDADVEQCTASAIIACSIQVVHCRTSCGCSRSCSCGSTYYSLRRHTTKRNVEEGLAVARAALEDNDSNSVLGTVGDLIETGLTATNVMDVQLVLVDRQ